MNKIRKAICLEKKINKYTRFIKHCNEWKKKHKQEFKTLINSMNQDELIKFGEKTNKFKLT